MKQIMMSVMYGPSPAFDQPVRPKVWLVGWVDAATMEKHEKIFATKSSALSFARLEGRALWLQYRVPVSLRVFGTRGQLQATWAYGPKAGT